MEIAANNILVIVTRQIGDVLLATPLIHSLRRAYPRARLDVLVFDGTGGILSGNPDVNRIISVAEHPNLPQYWHLLRQIFRRYDLTVSTLSGDRPAFYALLAARRRVSIVPPKGAGGGWKKRAVHAWTELDNVNSHTVVQNLRLADLLEVPRHYHVVSPRLGDNPALDAAVPFSWRDEAFALLHIIPKWRYKRWTLRGWRALSEHLLASRLRLVLTGGPNAIEVAYINEMLAGMPDGIINLAGKLSLAQLAQLIENARLYVGPDTAVTHLAAAMGTPTVAIFGPSNPVKWGPWPHGFDENRSPYVDKQPLQRLGNVLLLQGLGDCVPCHQEGCDRHKASLSDCLQNMPPSRVISAADTMLDWGERQGDAARKSACR